jgi:hypothetical protein
MVRDGALRLLTMRVSRVPHMTTSSPRERNCAHRPPCDIHARRRSRVHHIPSRVRDDARPPLLPERDGAGFTDVLIGLRNELFLRRGLDHPNQLECAEQIKFCVKSNSGLAGSMCIAIAARDLPVGKISGAVASRCRRMIRSSRTTLTSTRWRNDPSRRMAVDLAYDCDAFISGRCSLAMVSPKGPVLTRSGAALSGFSSDSSGNTSSAKR